MVLVLLLQFVVAQLSGATADLSSTLDKSAEETFSRWLPGFVRNWFGSAQRNLSKQEAGSSFARGTKAPLVQPYQGSAFTEVPPGSRAQPWSGQAPGPDLLDTKTNAAIAEVNGEVEDSLVGVKRLEKEVLELLSLLAMEAPAESGRTSALPFSGSRMQAPAESRSSEFAFSGSGVQAPAESRGSTFGFSGSRMQDIGFLEK
eukprot:CAMPEP_0172857124 /NCGR_PEP_ID=MMETSP1075-20121228/64441_1 /TAXON_ID=2916 /ORGANISM="Ceratium fusus, Strain PA161109" /LENGTH=201 /DNA_ID=CAMNT_0013704401 /DNA_START=84 /DNA_END=686 /DNA_ORIENTATION=+